MSDGNADDVPQAAEPVEASTPEEESGHRADGPADDGADGAADGRYDPHYLGGSRKKR